MIFECQLKVLKSILEGKILTGEFLKPSDPGYESQAENESFTSFTSFSCLEFFFLEHLLVHVSGVATRSSRSLARGVDETPGTEGSGCLALSFVSILISSPLSRPNPRKMASQG